MSRAAMLGAALWIALVVGSALHFVPPGTIELLFLLAPLVVVPLGLNLSAKLASDTQQRGLLVRIARVMQLPAALCVAASFWFKQGPAAALLTSPWQCFAGIIALSGATRLFEERSWNLKVFCLAASSAYLPVGGAWLVASRLGLTPMGFQEPIVLLTAVHFHFAGFAAPLLAGTAWATFERSIRRTRAFFKTVAAGILAGTGLLAAGFVVGPHLKLAAALLIAVSESGLAVFFLAATRTLRPRLAQVLVGFSAASVLVAMVLAGVWAVGEFPLQPFVHLAEMAKFHGTANAIGFTLCGLLGWTLRQKSRVDENRSR